MLLSARTVRRSAVLGAAAAAVALTAASLGAGAPQAAPVTATSRRRVVPALAVAPHAKKLQSKVSPGASPIDCQQEFEGFYCYGPDEIRTAYSIQPLLDRGKDGRGRTIVIVDAYAVPGIRDDLKAFDATFGLPDPTLRIVRPQGANWDPKDPEQQGWAGETDLDVQWAHAVAPGAKIVLVQARSSDDADILAATKWAVDHNVGDVISQSFGEDERCVAPAIARAQHQVFQKATAKGITLFASSGDQGSAQPDCDGDSYRKAVSSPATDPLVTAVGGTFLDTTVPGGAYLEEATWNESDIYEAAGGGGYSRLVGKPWFQKAVVRGSKRAVPDVAYNAGINSGVICVFGDAATAGQGQAYFLVGGTSAGSPQWAGLAAIGAQIAHHRLGAINDDLYALGSSRKAKSLFHDITGGNNAFTYNAGDDNFVTVPGYAAKRGWDAATGWGSPIASSLVPALARRA